MEKYKEIERSIITKYRKDIWGKFVKGVSDYELIKENDGMEKDIILKVRKYMKLKMEKDI